MGEELMVLGLPVSHPLAHLAGDDSFRTFPEIDLRLLRDDSFTLISRETRIFDTARSPRPTKKPALSKLHLQRKRGQSVQILINLSHRCHDSHSSFMSNSP